MKESIKPERLAIVVPCYNEEEMLALSSEALRGVLKDLAGKGTTWFTRCLLRMTETPPGS